MAAGFRRTRSPLLGLALVAGWAVPHPSADAGLRPFVHLAALVLGFGAVVRLGRFGPMWMLGRQDLAAPCAQ